MGPLCLEQVVRIRVRSGVGRFGGDQRTAAQAEVRVLDVVRDIQLVLRGHLVGEAYASGAIILLLWRWPAYVRRVERGVLCQVVIVGQRHNSRIIAPLAYASPTRWP